MYVLSPLLLGGVETLLVTLIAGLVGLFPVGLYFLPAPGALKLIGVAPLLMVAAGVLLVRDLRRPEE